MALLIFPAPMPASLIETADQHRWSFHGTEITQVTVDPASIRFAAWTLEATFELRIGSRFELAIDGDTVTLDPSLPPVTLAPALQLIGQSISAVTIDRTGDLRLETTQGCSLVIRPHPQWEAWEISGDAVGDKSYVCEPGGGSPWG